VTAASWPAARARLPMGGMSGRRRRRPAAPRPAEERDDVGPGTLKPQWVFALHCTCLLGAGGLGLPHLSSFERNLALDPVQRTPAGLRRQLSRAIPSPQLCCSACRLSACRPGLSAAARVVSK